MPTRCAWVSKDPDYIAYHDDEWGVPVHDDQLLFEFLCLEGQQAGLSWLTVLKKRDHYRRCFKQFDPLKVARMQDNTIEKLLQDCGLIRNRLKLFSIRSNAQAFLKVQKEFGSFNDFLWAYVGDEAINNRFESSEQVPATTPVSDKLSKDLKKRGFKFVGSTICYAYMQAVGLVNDHSSYCYLNKT